MDRIKKIPHSLKNHFSEHKTIYTIVGTTLVYYLAITRPAVKSLDKFFKEKGINPMEYYLPEALAERNS